MSVRADSRTHRRRNTGCLPGSLGQLCKILLLGLLFTGVAHATPLPRVVLIIDDVGDNLALGEAAALLPGPINIAILPHTPWAERLAHLAHRRGKEIMLHAPMSNHGARALGPGALTASMDRATFARTLEANLDAVPHVRGLNNHMGSELTELQRPMDWLMQTLNRRQLFFVDSRTTALTTAERQAALHRVPHLRRHVFLDNQPRPDAIAAQFEVLLREARQRGTAVGIAHPYPETLAFLRTQLAALTLRGFELVPASTALAATAPPPCDTLTIDRCDLLAPLNLDYRREAQKRRVVDSNKRELRHIFAKTAPRALERR